MPIDDITPTEPDAAPQGEPAAPAAADAQAPMPISAEQFADLAAQAAASGNQPVLDALQTLTRTLEAAAAPAPAEPMSGDELAERLLTDTKGTLRGETTEIVKELLAKPLGRSFEVARDERIEVRAAELDKNWGEGFFDETIRPRLTGEQGVLASWSVDQQSDPDVIDNAINAILGNDYRDPEKAAVMSERLQSVAKARAERDAPTPPQHDGPRPLRPHEG